MAPHRCGAQGCRTPSPWWSQQRGTRLKSELLQSPHQCHWWMSIWMCTRTWSLVCTGALLWIGRSWGGLKRFVGGTRWLTWCQGKRSRKSWLHSRCQRSQIWHRFEIAAGLTGFWNERIPLHLSWANAMKCHVASLQCWLFLLVLLYRHHHHQWKVANYRQPIITDNRQS